MLSPAFVVTTNSRLCTAFTPAWEPTARPSWNLVGLALGPDHRVYGLARLPFKGLSPTPALAPRRTLFARLASSPSLTPRRQDLFNSLCAHAIHYHTCQLFTLSITNNAFERGGRLLVYGRTLLDAFRDGKVTIVETLNHFHRMSDSTWLARVRSATNSVHCLQYVCFAPTQTAFAERPAVAP